MHYMYNMQNMCKKLFMTYFDIFCIFAVYGGKMTVWCLSRLTSLVSLIIFVCIEKFHPGFVQWICGTSFFSCRFFWMDYWPMKCSNTTGCTRWIRHWTHQMSWSGSRWLSFSGTICIVDDIHPRTRLISRILLLWVTGEHIQRILHIVHLIHILYIIGIWNNV